MCLKKNNNMHLKKNEYAFENFVAIDFISTIYWNYIVENDSSNTYKVNGRLYWCAKVIKIHKNFLIFKLP